VRSGYPVDLQAPVSLKAPDRVLGERTKEAVDRPRWVARAGQQTLHVPHRP
jgi:hypothetical protein